MNIQSFFWNNYKQQWYHQGKLFKEVFNNITKNWSIGQVNQFIIEQTDVILKNQKQQSQESIIVLEAEIKEIKSNILKEKEWKSKEIQQIEENYKIIEDNITEEYKMYLTVNTENFAQADELLKNFNNNMSQYITNIKWNIKWEVEKLFNYLNKEQQDNISIVEKEAKKILNQNLDWYINVDARIDGSKDIVLLLFLWAVCLYDVFFGYKVVHDFVLWMEISATLLNLISVWLAIIFVMMLIWFTHFLVKTIENPKSKVWKQMSLGMLFIMVLLLWRYIQQSNPTLTMKQLFSAENTNAIETIFRTLLLPALLVGEIIIDRINRDNIFLYWKKIMKPFRIVKSLITKQLYLLQEKGVRKAAKIESEAIIKMAQETTSVIDVSYSYHDMLNIVSEVQNLLTPIYKSHDEKVSMWKNKVTEIQKEMALKKEIIENKYKEFSEKEWAAILIKENLVNHIKRQLWEAENSVWEWLKIGLLS